MRGGGDEEGVITAQIQTSIQTIGLGIFVLTNILNSGTYFLGGEGEGGASIGVWTKSKL